VPTDLKGETRWEGATSGAEEITGESARVGRVSSRGQRIRSVQEKIRKREVGHYLGPSLNPSCGKVRGTAAWGGDSKNRKSTKTKCHARKGTGKILLQKPRTTVCNNFPPELVEGKKSRRGLWKDCQGDPNVGESSYKGFEGDKAGKKKGGQTISLHSFEEKTWPISSASEVAPKGMGEGRTAPVKTAYRS